MSGSASGPSQITNVTGPPAYAEPYHVNALQFGAEAAEQPYQPYLGPRVAGFTPEQEAGLNAMVQRGTSGSPVDAAAQQQAVGTMQGNYLDPMNNEPLQNMLNYGQRQVMANYGAQLGQNFGNSGVQEVVGDAMGRSLAPLYESERQRQMQAMGMSGQLSGTDYRDIQSVLGAGDARQALQQRQMDVPYEEFSRAQMWPSYQMGLLSQSINAGSVGGQGSQTNPYQGNALQNALGLGTLGYMAAPSIGASGINPWAGAAAGAGLGLLMS